MCFRVGLLPVTMVDSLSLEKYCLLFLFQFLLTIVFVLGSGMPLCSEVGPLNIEAQLF